MGPGVRHLEAGDLGQIVAAFEGIGWDKPRSLYEWYLSEQSEGRRVIFVASLDGAFAGYVTLNWRSGYRPFREDGVPEIQDFNVIPRFRRRGVGTSLMDRAERTASERSAVVGLGVGMSPDYGAAQRLYVLRGYVPDGRGLARDGRTVPHGAAVTVDDGLALYMTKALRHPPHPGDHR